MVELSWKRTKKNSFSKDLNAKFLVILNPKKSIENQSLTHQLLFTWIYTQIYCKFSACNTHIVLSSFVVLNNNEEFNKVFVASQLYWFLTCLICTSSMVKSYQFINIKVLTIHIHFVWSSINALTSKCNVCSWNYIWNYLCGYAFIYLY